MKKEETIRIVLSVVISFAGICNCSNVMTYLGGSSPENISYSRYYPWQSTGGISFDFKTGNPNGLLLHVGDSNSTEWTRNYIQLRIRNGLPNVISRIKSRTNTVRVKRVWHKIEVDDMNWHRIQIRLDGNLMKFTVDGESSLVNIAPVKLTGALYIGGLPYSSSSSCRRDKYSQGVGCYCVRTRRKNLGHTSHGYTYVHSCRISRKNPCIEDRIISYRTRFYLTRKSRMYEIFMKHIHVCPRNRFIGAIENVSYNSYVKFQTRGYGIVETKGTSEGLINPCRMSRRGGKLCQEGGTEVNEFNKCSCNCLGTGFEGSRCQEVSTPVKLNGLDIIKWKPFSPHTSSEANEIKLVFKTTEPSGILVYIGNSTKYLMVELFRGILMVRIRLDTSKENLSLNMSNRRLDDNCWHLMEVSRRELQLKASINGTRTLKVALDVDNIHRTLSDSEIFIGGKRYLDSLSGSRSKQDFMGCLREIYYNGENIGKTIMDTYRRTTDKRLTILGKIAKGCPTRVTKAPFTRVPRSKRHRPTFRRHTKSNRKNKQKKDTSNRSPRLKKISGAPQTILIIGTILGIIVLIIVVAATVHYIKRRYREELALSAIFTRTPTETGTSSGTMHMHITPSSSGEKNDRFREIRE